MLWKRGLLLLFVLGVLVAVAACGGKSHASSVAKSSAGVQSTDAAVTGGPFKAVFEAFSALRQNYYRETDDSRLLAAAWSGALGLYVSQVGPIAASAAPASASGLAAEEEALAGALARLEDAAGDQLDASDLAFAAIESMAGSLKDDHTFYLRPDAWDRYQKGETIGFGYSTVRRGDAILVWYVYPDGSADRAGVKAGDLVETVDDDQVYDTGGKTLVDGQTVVLGVDRPGAGLLSIEATAEKYLRPVLESRVIDGVGYVRVYRFPNPNQLPVGQTFSGLLDGTLRDLKSQGASSWVLDLRNNAGGAEAAAASLAGRLGYKGTLIENRGRSSTSKTVANGDSAIDGQPLVVLINENSGSSAEIVADALGESGLAYLAGVQTGGVVNTSHAYPAGGGALFVTTDHLFAGPHARYLDGSGVLPDRAVSLDRNELAYGRDSQLDWAVSYLKAREGAAVGAR